jgi:hypothetical protein
MERRGDALSEGKAFWIEPERQRLWLAFLVQMMAVPLLCEAVTFLVVFIAKQFVSSLFGFQEFMAWILVVSIVAVALGISVVSTAPSWSLMGRWIWVPWTVLLAFDVWSDLRVMPQYYTCGRSGVIATFLGDASGDEGLNLLFGTYPLVAAISYSLALAWRTRISRRFRHEEW